MHKVVSILTYAAFWTAGLFFAGSCYAETEENVLPNGTFGELNEGALPKSWRYGSKQNGHVSIVEEGAAKFLRVHMKDKGNLALTKELRLKPGWLKLKVSSRMRVRDLVTGAKHWENARIMPCWLDAKYNLVGGWPPGIQLTRDSDWSDLSVDMNIPGNASFLRLSVGLWGSSGVFDIEHVKVSVAERLYWGEEPVVDLNAKRSEIVLNGVWSFVPAVGPVDKNPPNAWGYIRVPGTWNRYASLPGILAKGSGPAWKGVDLNSLAKAWYRRPFNVPEQWKGRCILLDLQRVSTDCVVYVNGEKCGEINWPDGVVDITKAVKFGQENEFKIMVVAVADKREVKVCMGQDQNYTRKAKLATRGITGDVVLKSRPQGAYVSDVFVQTSTRKKELKLSVEMKKVATEGQASFTAHLLDENGKEEKSFTASSPLKAGNVQVVDLMWTWEDPRLWDYGKPNLYTLQLEVKGNGLDDMYPQQFGFREFWIEGRKFFLNGTEFRLRPRYGGGGNGGYFPTNYEVGMKKAIEGKLNWGGSNISVCSPGDPHARGSIWHTREMWARIADEVGWPTVTGTMGAAWMAWNDNSKRVWRRRLVPDIRRYRNHPSILMWIHSRNYFGHWDDQNPLRMGRKAWDDLGEGYKAKARAGEEVGAMIKEVDPTRPVMAYQCGPVSDVYSLDNYLCFIPLQEREEWLSHWAEHGDMPYMAVEFGLPTPWPMSRGRNGGDKAGITEFLPTEFCATYLGERSFAKETPEFRKALKEVEEIVIKAEASGNPLKPQWSWNFFTLRRKGGGVLWAFQELAELFIHNTFHSWRTMGVTGGLIPWNHAGIMQGIPPPKDAKKKGGGWLYPKQPPFKPGQRGAYFDRIPTRQGRPAEWNEPPLNSAVAIGKMTRPSLAWIAGSPQAWVAKDHHFYSGEKIRKQVVLLSDEREERPFTYTVTVTFNKKEIESFKNEGTIGATETRFIPFDFTPPAVSAKTSGVIKMAAKIGDEEHTDEFPLRVYPRLAKTAMKSPVLIVDPEGDTRRTLEEVGIQTQDWDGGILPGRVLVIGRRALGKALPGDLEAFAREGGRVVIHGQEQDWMRQSMGLRINSYLSRRCWPVTTQRDHPLVKGLDGEDFRDWRGSGTLVPEYLHLGAQSGDGWHWSNKGTVSSCMIEKPHCAGWTPILEGEFDLAFSPLMELEFGKGLVILNMLDVEGREGLDPVTDLMTGRIVKYAAEARVEERTARTVHMGSPSSRRLLKGMNLQFEEGRDHIPEGAGLVVVDADTKLKSEDIETHVEGGGRAVFLPPWPESLPFGLSRGEPALGRYAPIPQAEAARGISVSDVHTRYDVAADSVQGRGVTKIGDGVLSVVKVGKGEAWFVGLTPQILGAKERPYLRYSTWRLTRALCQVLTNCGARFMADRKVFASGTMDLAPIALAGKWLTKVELPLVSVSDGRKHTDPGNKGEALGWHQEELDVRDWRETVLPGAWEGRSQSSNIDGAVWFRKRVKLPPGSVGKELVLELGPIDDFDITYVNGKKVGSTGTETPRFWVHPREYTVPAKVNTEPTCVIAVRVWDHFGGGGLYAKDPKKLCLYPKDKPDQRIFLGGEWKYAVEVALKPAGSLSQAHKDPGISEKARSWMSVDLDESEWKAIALPGMFERGMAAFDGAVWFRREVMVPEAYAGKELALELGPLDDFDTTYFNGTRIGSTGPDVTDAKAVARRYIVPVEIVKSGGKNVISVRVFDQRGSGGFVGQAEDMKLFIPGIPASAAWYVPGYRTDHATGDSPTRYWRW